MLQTIAEAVEAERVRKMAEAKTGMKYKENSPDNKLTEEMLQTIAEAVEAAKAEKNRLAAIQQHSGGCDNKLTDPQPTRQPERVTEKAEPCGNKLPEPKTNPEKNRQKHKAKQKKRGYLTIN